MTVSLSSCSIWWLMAASVASETSSQHCCNSGNCSGWSSLVRSLTCDLKTVGALTISIRPVSSSVSWHNAEVDKLREIIALDRQGTQQQRSELPTVTPPGMWVNTRWEFIYLIFTRMPGEVTVVDSGLCCRIPCLSSAIISLCLLNLHRHSRSPVSDYKHRTVARSILSSNWLSSLTEPTLNRNMSAVPAE